MLFSTLDYGFRVGDGSSRGLGDGDTFRVVVFESDKSELMIQSAFVLNDSRDVHRSCLGWSDVRSNDEFVRSGALVHGGSVVVQSAQMVELYASSVLPVVGSHGSRGLCLDGSGLQGLLDAYIGTLVDGRGDGLRAVLQYNGVPSFVGPRQRHESLGSDGIDWVDGERYYPVVFQYVFVDCDDSPIGRTLDGVELTVGCLNRGTNDFPHDIPRGTMRIRIPRETDDSAGNGVWGLRILANRSMTRFIVEYHGVGDLALRYACGDEGVPRLLDDTYDFLRGLNMVVGPFDYHGIIREVHYWGATSYKIESDACLVEHSFIGMFKRLSPRMVLNGNRVPIQVAWEDFIMEEHPEFNSAWSPLQSLSVIDFDADKNRFTIHDELPMDFLILCDKLRRQWLC